ncbi:hypothetical protein Trydic_g21352 [Trypoxylus dichotomus]
MGKEKKSSRSPFHRQVPVYEGSRILRHPSVPDVRLTPSDRIHNLIMQNAIEECNRLKKEREAKEASQIALRKSREALRVRPFEEPDRLPKLGIPALDKELEAAQAAQAARISSRISPPPLLRPSTESIEVMSLTYLPPPPPSPKVTAYQQTSRDFAITSSHRKMMAASTSNKKIKVSATKKPSMVKRGRRKIEPKRSAPRRSTLTEDVKTTESVLIKPEKSVSRGSITKPKKSGYIPGTSILKIRKSSGTIPKSKISDDSTLMLKESADSLQELKKISVSLPKLKKSALALSSSAVDFFAATPKSSSKSLHTLSQPTVSPRDLRELLSAPPPQQDSWINIIWVEEMEERFKSELQSGELDDVFAHLTKEDIHHRLAEIRKRLQAQKSMTEYHPYVYRRNAKGISNLAAIAFLTKALLGSGVLRMPMVHAHIGQYFAVISTLFIFLWISGSFHIYLNANHQLCKRLRRPYLSYAETMAEALQIGPRFARYMPRWSGGALNFLVVFHQVAVSMKYSMFVGIYASLTFDTTSRGIAHSIYAIPFLFLAVAMLYIKSLRKFMLFAIVGNFVAFIHYAIVLYQLTGRLGQMLSVTDCIATVLSVEAKMKHPRFIKGYSGIFNVALLFSGLWMIMIGFFGSFFPLDILWAYCIKGGIKGDYHKRIWMYLLRASYGVTPFFITYLPKAVVYFTMLVGYVTGPFLMLFCPVVVHFCVSWSKRGQKIHFKFDQDTSNNVNLSPDYTAILQPAVSRNVKRQVKGTSSRLVFSHAPSGFGENYSRERPKCVTDSQTFHRRNTSASRENLSRALGSPFFFTAAVADERPNPRAKKATLRQDGFSELTIGSSAGV